MRLPPLNPHRPSISIVGGGPAGLFAAEVASRAGASVTLYESMPSVGRKFLVAGKGGLNLTNTESSASFPKRYSGHQQPPGFWEELLAEFSPSHLCEWAKGFGIKTIAATTGRIYPNPRKAAPLLRRWIARLKEAGVRFVTRHEFRDLSAAPGSLQLLFQTREGLVTVESEAIVLAMGGGSWPQTGSNANWTAALANRAVQIHPLQPANCGWEVNWPASILAESEGQPVKNLVVRAGDKQVKGELLITRYGLEGGPIYELGPFLRKLDHPLLCVDLKPTFSIAQLVEKMGSRPGGGRYFLRETKKSLNLQSSAYSVLLGLYGDLAFSTAEPLIQLVKNCAIPLLGPRPLAEAISSAGGVCWSELNSWLMLRRIPGVFIAGEMIDWEAPTGGYLLQGCFATGTRAAQGALRHIQSAGKELQDT